MKQFSDGEIQVAFPSVILLAETLRTKWGLTVSVVMTQDNDGSYDLHIQADSDDKELLQILYTMLINVQLDMVESGAIGKKFKLVTVTETALKHKGGGS